MPYRRLPNTDAARLRALKNALDKSERVAVSDIAFSLGLKQKIEFFLPKFEVAIKNSAMAKEQQFGNSPKFSEYAKKARLYVSHFIQVLNFCIARGEMKPAIRRYYGLDEKSSKVPSLVTEQDLLQWGEKIINGEQETGVTTFFLTHEIDTGKIILQRRLPIAETDDVGKVHDELMTLGAGLVTETVDLILAGKAEAIPQDQFMRDAEELRPAPKIFKDTCRIDWHLPLKRIYDFVRGLSPYPAAWTELVDIDGKHQVLKVYETEMRPAVHTDAAGTLRTDGKTYLEVAVEGGYLRLLSLQLAGKKRMPVSAFLNGMKQHPVQVE